MKYFNKEGYLKSKTWILKHRFISSIIAIIILAIFWYSISVIKKASAETRYILGNVSTSTIISTVSASGQVTSSDEINIKPKVSAEIVWIGIKAGDTVRAGQALMSMDSTDARRSVVEAQQSLATSKLQYQKDSASAPIDYQKAIDNLNSAKDDLNTTFNDTFNSLSNTYLDMPNIVTGSQNIIHGYDLSSNNSQWNIDVLKNIFTNEDDREKIVMFADSAEKDYASARKKYDASVISYKSISRNSSNTDVSEVLSESIDTTTAVAQALQSELNLLGAIIDIAQTRNIRISSTITSMQTNAKNYLSTTNSDLSNLLSQKKSIDSAQKNVKSYEQTLTLLQVGNSDGNNPISLQISKNNLETQEQNLINLKTDLNNYTVYSPFDGIVSAVNVKKGDTSSGTVATVITKQQIAQLSLNEVDAAKVNVGNKATLTFDAVSDLTMTGTVVEKDSVGTVSSGVVSYTVKIAFDTQDSRINPGMTVNATIQTAIHKDVLTVPSTAIKTKNGVSYVQVFDSLIENTNGTQGITSKTSPKQNEVTIGISDDTNTEILSGLTAGQQIIVKTVTSSSSKTISSTKTTTSATRMMGGPGF